LLLFYDSLLERKTHGISSIFLIVGAYLLKKGFPYNIYRANVNDLDFSLQFDGVETTNKSYAKQLNKCPDTFGALMEVAIKVTVFWNRR
jgi:hypothetical protein